MARTKQVARRRGDVSKAPKAWRHPAVPQPPRFPSNRRPLDQREVDAAFSAIDADFDDMDSMTPDSKIHEDGTLRSHDVEDSPKRDIELNIEHEIGGEEDDVAYNYSDDGKEEPEHKDVTAAILQKALTVNGILPKLLFNYQIDSPILSYASIIRFPNTEHIMVYLDDVVYHDNATFTNVMLATDLSKIVFKGKVDRHKKVEKPKTASREGGPLNRKIQEQRVIADEGGLAYTFDIYYERVEYMGAVHCDSMVYYHGRAIFNHVDRSYENTWVKLRDDSARRRAYIVDV